MAIRLGKCIDLMAILSKLSMITKLLLLQRLMQDAEPRGAAFTLLNPPNENAFCRKKPLCYCGKMVFGFR